MPGVLDRLFQILDDGFVTPGRVFERLMNRQRADGGGIDKMFSTIYAIYVIETSVTLRMSC